MFNLCSNPRLNAPRQNPRCSKGRKKAAPSLLELESAMMQEKSVCFQRCLMHVFLRVFWSSLMKGDLCGLCIVFKLLNLPFKMSGVPIMGSPRGCYTGSGHTFLLESLR